MGCHFALAARMGGGGGGGSPDMVSGYNYRGDGAIRFLPHRAFLQQWGSIPPCMRVAQPSREGTSDCCEERLDVEGIEYY